MNLIDRGRRILELHNAVNLCGTFRAAAEIGGLLAEGKAELPHGRYTPWVGSLGIAWASAGPSRSRPPGGPCSS